MTADLIIYGIIAGVLVFWLKSILGTRHGDERSRDNPFAAPENKTSTGQDSNVIQLPTLQGPSIRITKTTLAGRVRIETPDVEVGLKTIAEADPRFNLDHFMEGAEDAFELIVTSFAKGDRTTLKSLLTPTVYNDFERAIIDRDTRAEKVETRIESIPAMDIMAASMKDKTAFISIRFTAQETCLIRNAAGVIIAGDPEKTTTMIDIWTFGRDTTTQNPVWYVYETRDEQIEAHKTPLPESR